MFPAFKYIVVIYFILGFHGLFVYPKNRESIILLRLFRHFNLMKIIIHLNQISQYIYTYVVYLNLFLPMLKTFDLLFQELYPNKKLDPSLTLVRSHKYDFLHSQRILIENQ